MTRAFAGKASAIMAFFTRFLEWIKSLFWKEEMELTLVGLQNSGKTTFVNVIAVRACVVCACGGVIKVCVAWVTGCGCDGHCIPWRGHSIVECCLRYREAGSPL